MARPWATRSIVVLASVAVACAAAGAAGGYASRDPTSADEYIALEERLGQAEATLDDLQEEYGQFRAESEQRLADAEAAVAVAERRAEDAESNAAEAERTAQDIRLRFDPEIRQAVSEIQSTLEADACAAANESVASALALPTAMDIVQSDAAQIPGVPPEEIEERLNLDTIQARIGECAALARRTMDKPDGFFLVGTEIAPGRWRAKGQFGNCSWARRGGTSGESSDVIAEGYGTPGVIVTILASDVAFSTQGCGGWTYLGEQEGM